MASQAMPRALFRARPNAGPQCALTGSPWSLAALHRGRGVAQTYLKKVAEGAERWAERAEKIKKGEIPHVWDVLNERGYMKDVAGTTKIIKETMRVKRIGAYVGVDPTADSLHLGHLIPFMALRAIVSNGVIAKNITKTHYQISKIWSNVAELKRKYEYPDDWAAKRHLLNNSMWLQGLSMVKQRMEGGEGISVGELIYPLFQGWDFWHMFKKLGIQMQIGGSDQFGNIVSGIDAVKIIRENEETGAARMPNEWCDQPLGFTVPLLTDSSGAKLGKSAGNALWLDEFKTSAFDLYGYFVRRSDDEVERLLKLLTFIPMAKIQDMMVEHRQDPTKRLAQHTLAFEVLSLVHGSQKALEEAQQHEFRFGGKLPPIVKVPTQDSGIVVPNNAPRSDIELPRSVLDLSPAKILFACGLASSASDGQRLVKQEGAYVAAQPGQKKGLVPGNLNWTPIKMWFPEETARYVLDDHILILRKGKHNVRIIELVSDEDWEKSKKIYPGQPLTGFVRRAKAAMKEQAEARGEPPMRAKDFRLQLLEQKKLWVANNPSIEFPTKRELRERSHWEKRGSSRRPRSTSFDPPSTGLNPPSTGFEPPSTGFEPPSTGFEPPSTGFSRPYSPRTRPPRMDRPRSGVTSSDFFGPSSSRLHSPRTRSTGKRRGSPKPGFSRSGEMTSYGRKLHGLPDSEDSKPGGPKSGGPGFRGPDAGGWNPNPIV
ncbi:Tyrosyl-tRNA synthetase [Ophiocordyceps sinensis CO18]|uniref:Tyrosine--tRNA ligase n=1 Tax=Ophiocordyceps sinensis (strain Co18 / CGMCC 3.14243) TaxID=911162 RepID=T5A9A9_OPHSC|nr:Tyrosyl-tRNA synthetase [Ophiocordyceps sinensis CO18]